MSTMGLDAMSLFVALAVVFLPLLLAWGLLSRGERRSRRPDADAPVSGTAQHRRR